MASCRRQPVDKAALVKDQPAASRILSRMLVEDHLPNAVLLWGPAGAPVNETARFFADSILCPHPDEEGFACGPAGPEPTLFVCDRPKKKDITRLQEQFSVTSDTRKVSLLTNFDAATPEAANALLKFLEEPQPGIIHILTTQNKGGILPTIESRCQRIPLRPAGLEFRMSQLTMLPQAIREAAACAGYTPADLEENAFYEQIAPAITRYMGEWKVPAGLYHLQKDLFVPKGENTTRPMVRLFLECLLWTVKHSDLDHHHKSVVTPILMDGIWQMKRTADPSLCLDQTANRIRKGMIQ